MAIVRKTMEEIRKEMTPERMRAISESLKNHVDEYDEDCPPLTDEQLARFRPHREIPPEIELMAKVKAAEARAKQNKEYNDKDYTPPRAAA